MSKQPNHSEPTSEDNIIHTTEENAPTSESDVSTHKTRRASIWVLTIVALLVAGGSVYLLKPTLLDDTATLLSPSKTQDASTTQTAVPASTSDLDQSSHPVADEPVLPTDSVLATDATAVKSADQLPELTQAAVADLEGFYFEKVSPKLDALTQELQSLQDKIASLEAKNQSLQNELSALANVSNEQYALRQVQYFLKLAQSELNLAHNPYTAAQALEAALNVARQHTVLTALADSLSSDLVAVKLAQSKTVTHLYDQTRTLAVQLQQASLMTPENLATRSDETATQKAEDLSWYNAIWQDVVALFDSDWGGLVKVEKISAADQALLDLSQTKRLRHTMAINIQLAQQALISGNTDVWQATLSDIIDGLNHFYYAGDELTQEALKSAQQLLRTDIMPKLPDLQLSQQAFEQTQSILNKE